MKIDANIEFSEKTAKQLGRDTFKVAVDIDYVEDNVESVYEYVSNELAEKFGGVFFEDEYEIKNLNEIIEEIKFDEFKQKTS